MTAPKAAIYCRLSEEDHNKGEAESESIQNQRTMLLQYAAEMGWAVTDIYCDEDYTGADRSRPDFNRLLQDAENKKFDIVLCKSQSRFTRELELVEKYLHGRFAELGIRFVGYADHADTDNRGNKKARQINGLVNEWYLEDLSDNIRTVMRSKQRAGCFIGSFAPYGYRKSESDKNRLVPDEEAAEVVRIIFEERLRGVTVPQIARNLNESGVVNPSTYKAQKQPGFRRANIQKTEWSGSTVRSILENPVYCGNMRQHVREKVSYKSDRTRRIPKAEQIVVEDTHPPIVSKAQWCAAQGRISDEILCRTAGGRQNFCFCGICGKKLYVRYSHGKKYFTCRAHCVLIREDAVRKSDILSGDEQKSDTSQKERELLQRKMQMAYDDMAAGILCREQFEAMNKEWRRQWDKLRRTEKKIDSEMVLLVYPRTNRSAEPKTELLTKAEWQKRRGQGMASTMPLR